jgi:hypothetical protein
LTAGEAEAFPDERDAVMDGAFTGNGWWVKRKPLPASRSLK